MKNNKENAGESFRKKVLSGIIYSLLITLIAEFFLVRNLLTAADFGTEVRPDNRTIRRRQRCRISAWWRSFCSSCSGSACLPQYSGSCRGSPSCTSTRISETMQTIAGGDLNAFVEVDGDDEFSGMAENLNLMTEDIRNLMDRERESERTKNELITNIAHDLRTPLTSIIGYLEILTTEAGPAGGDPRPLHRDRLHKVKEAAAADQRPVRLHEAELREDRHAGVQY